MKDEHYIVVLTGSAYVAIDFDVERACRLLEL